MNRPGLRTLVLGSRLTAPPILLGSGWYAWHWWQAGGVDNTGLIAIVLFVVSAKATTEMAAYRQWRADWRAMATGGETRNWRPKPTTIASLVGLLLIGVGMVWAQSPDAPAGLRDHLAPLAVGCAALAVLLILGRLVWRFWPRRRGKMPVVTLVNGGPIHRPLSIRACYRRLPPHCQTLLKGRPS